ncbi:MAG: hypothetical protein QM817_38350 [Archangium sp.]
MRAALHGSRAPHVLDAPAPTAELAWQKVLELDARRPEVKKSYRAFPRAAGWLKAVRASFDRGERPVKLTLEHEVLRLAMLWSDDLLGRSSLPTRATPTALVDFWATTAGVEFVLDVIEAPHLFNQSADLSKGLHLEFVDPRAKGGAFIPGHYLSAVPLLCALRPHVFRLDATTYARALRRAEKLQKRLVASKDMDDGTVFDALCFAFAREKKWVNVAARRVCKPSGSISNGGLVLSGVTDAALAMQVAKSMLHLLPTLVAPFAFDLVESLNENAAPVLELALSHPAKGAEKRTLQAALKLCRG